MPTKAVVGSGVGAVGTGVAGAIVAISLYYSGSTPPQEIVIAWTTIVTSIIAIPSTFFAVYFAKMEGS